MKSRVIFSLLFLSVISITSCRTEETELILTPDDEILASNSIVAQLMQRATSNDGSIDNIVDRANCFDIKFPYSVNVNSEEITLSSNSDFARVECVFDQSDDDTDTLDIMFPVNIVLADFSEITINNEAELNSYSANCNGENVADIDIECIDFQYPIEASSFNSNSELLETLNLENDYQLYDFIENISPSDIITMDFPLVVILADASNVSITNFNELQTIIENNINACDEDDDYDYNEDDCDDCTLVDIENLLTTCNDWAVNTLRRDSGTNYDDVYYNYDFNFFNDGTMSVFWNTTTVYGTWIANGSGNAIEVIIDVPALPLCNNNWIIREIKNCSDETEIDMRVGIDRIQYVKNCN
ncbi:hypothetical protein [Winogradskyella sp. PG-2]|uniref:hypothetical protein n=1 Tax=Winogradskyella sp. PG-2 TaxID=754409 RepID=UPI0004586CA7|nr:hypothetical protein [Winogradskyella sp. PG-2]BAO75744.1 hypothetical protein WPG_1514 [Winogradskyella sp. PG-2]